MKSVKDIRETFKNLYRYNEFITDKSGSKTLEIIGDSYSVRSFRNWLNVKRITF